MEKVPVAKVATATEASEMPLPAQIQDALGELVGAAREGCSRSASASDSASFTRPCPPADPRARYRLTIKPRRPPSKFHDDPDILGRNRGQ